MRILLDECVPRPLKREFVGHDARTVREMGWAGKQNGELIQLLVADGFEIFLTVDQNLQHQQNLRAANVGVVVLIAATNKIADLKPLIPSVLSALSGIQPGQLVEIDT